MPHSIIQQAFDVAVQHHQAGRLQEAERLYRQILARNPRHAEALQNLGLIAEHAGRDDVAADLFRQATTLKPNLPEAHNNLGNALRRLGQRNEAIAAYSRAIDLRPDYAEAHYNLGSLLAATGRLDSAIAAFHRAIAFTPNYAEAYNNLGVAQRDQGKLDESIIAHRKAIALNPNFPEALSNLANALREQGQSDEAIAVYRRAIALRPGSAEAHSNLGIALADQGQLDEGVAAFRQAIALNPNLPETHSNLIFTLLHHPACDGQALAEEEWRWNRQHANPLRKFIQPHSNDRSPDRPLRIGYVSPDFRDHAVGRNLLPLFHRHNHREFEIHCYANVVRPDSMTNQFRQHADRWRDISDLSDESAAKQIREDRIDILVDLALHTAKNRLLIFARKPAPLQVTFAGYPGSTGLTTMDYRLSDPQLDPPGMDESVYSEQTIRLEHSFWCYDPLDMKAIPMNSLPAEASEILTFGCLNKFYKVNEMILALWGRVLREVPNSRLLLLAAPGTHRERTLDLFSKEGVNSSRIEFVSPLPRPQYLELYHRIDLGLDSFPYNGHTTSLDSFWMGVPVVTLVGQTVVSRAGWSQLSNLGMTELAADSPEKFVQIAAGLAQDPERLKELRRTLRERMEQSPLMDAVGFARNIETAYRHMWRDWCQGP